MSASLTDSPKRSLLEIIFSIPSGESAENCLAFRAVAASDTSPNAQGAAPLPAVTGPTGVPEFSVRVRIGSVELIGSDESARKYLIPTSANYAKRP
jgi:hypothetical protein